MSGEHSPSLQTATAVQVFHPPSVPGQYEDIDLSPVGSVTNHKYEPVRKDENGVSYSRLQRSKSRNASSSGSHSGLSTSPVIPIPPHEEQPSPPLRENEIFDNPKYSYSQLFRPTSQNIDIYKGGASDSSNGRNYSQSPSDALESEVAAHNLRLGSSSEEKGDDYHQDASAFVVSALVRDETKLSIPPHTELPTTHYTSISTSGVAQDESYTLPIVSTNDKYVSEKGHLYYVLEEAPPESVGKERVVRKTSVPSYRIPTTSDEPAYDVIDRSVMQSSASNRLSLDCDLYDVIDRRSNDGRIGPSVSSSRAAPYDVIERKTSLGNLTQLDNRPGYEVIGTSTSSSNKAAVYSTLESREGGVVNSRDSPPPPPSYSSLGLGEAGRRKGSCSGIAPVYQILELTNESKKEVCRNEGHGSLSHQVVESGERNAATYHITSEP